LSAKLTALLLGLIVPVALFSMPFGGPAPEPTATTTAFTFYSGAASATWTPDYGPWSAGVGAWGNLDPAVLTGGSPAVIIAKNPAWALISPSSWISYADTTTNGPANGVTVTFTVDFLLPAGATSPTVSVSALGDDSVTVSLNGNAFGPSPLASYATVGTASTSDASLFHTGSEANQLQFLVAQTGGDGFGLDFSATVTFTAASGPVAAFSWTPTVPEEGVQFQITDLSTDPDNDIVKREWDFGDGTGITFITLTHPSHTYGHAGSYTVTLTVTDAAGNPGTSAPVTMTVTQKIVAEPFPWWIVILLIVVVAVMLLLFFLMKRRKKEEEEAVPPPPGAAPPPPEELPPPPEAALAPPPRAPPPRAAPPPPRAPPRAPVAPPPPPAAAPPTAATKECASCGTIVSASDTECFMCGAKL